MRTGLIRFGCSFLAAEDEVVINFWRASSTATFTVGAIRNFARQLPTTRPLITDRRTSIASISLGYELELQPHMIKMFAYALVKVVSIRFVDQQ